MFRTLQAIHVTIRTTNTVEVTPPKKTPTTVGIEQGDSDSESTALLSKRGISVSNGKMFKVYYH